MPGDVSGPNPPSSGAPPVRTTGGSALWTPPSPEHLQRLLPQYEILSMIGRGGMGAVYKGRQISLDRFVAIKILPPEALEGDETADFAERFKNEARSMARMNHPAIVGVYDFGETSEGQLFIVMEYVDATDVAQMIKSQGRLPPEHALAITAHVCDALQYAHSRGVIHRDIKPANVLMSMEGRVKIADFGLAKATDPDALAITKTNMAMGTPDFIAPEALITGLLVDHRADLYAVGVMLYNMLTGRIPRGVFTPASKLAGSDPRYDGIVTKAMQTEREERYQSATELRRDLDVILTVPMAKPESASQRRAPPAVARKPVARSPQSRNDGTPAVAQPATASDGRSAFHPKRSSAAMIAGITGAAAVILAGAFFAFKKPASTGPSAVLAQELESLPAEEQVARVVARLKELTPGFNGTETHKIQDGKVVELRLGEGTGDLSPLSALQDVRVLHCPGSAKQQKKDLSPLKNLPLTELELHHAFIKDLSPLAGLKLKKLGLGFTQVEDLSPLKGMPLKRLFCEKTRVTDLSPLRDTPLEELSCDYVAARDTEILRSIKTLKKINGKPAGEFWAAVESPVKPPVSPSIPANPPPAMPDSSKGAVNLIASVDLKRDGIDGTWSVKNGELHGSGGYARLAFDYQPPEEYDFCISFTRTGGNNAVAQHVALGGHDVMWLMGGFGNSVWGFEQVGGKSGKDNPTSVKSGLENGRRYRSMVKVRRDRLQVEVDGRQVAVYNTDGADLGVFHTWKFPDSKKLGIGCQSDVVFHSIEMIPVTRDNSSDDAGMPAGTADPRLAQLETGFKARLESDAQKPFAAALAALNRSYVANGLAGARAAAQVKGLVAEVAALDTARQQIERGTRLPAADPDTMPASLRSLRATYRTALAKIEADRAQKVAPLYDLYLGALDRYITDLTREDRITEAQKVKTLRDEIALRKSEAGVSSPAGAPGTAKSQGRMKLFDGKSLHGWKVVGKAGLFRVADGSIHADGKGASIIYTGASGKPVLWKDFDLSFKAKTEARANSGVWIHCPAAPESKPALALEVQVDNEGPDTQKTGSIWSVKPVEKQEKEDGEWFDMRIVVKGATIAVFLDGRKINEWTQPAGWQPPAKVPDARLGEGTIGFQSNGGTVWFKDIAIDVP